MERVLKFRDNQHEEDRVTKLHSGGHQTDSGIEQNDEYDDASDEETTPQSGLSRKAKKEIEKRRRRRAKKKTKPTTPVIEAPLPPPPTKETRKTDGKKRRKDLNLMMKKTIPMLKLNTSKKIFLLNVAMVIILILSKSLKILN